MRLAFKDSLAPSLALSLVEHYAKACRENGRLSVSFAVDDLPQSVNHQYTKTRYGVRLTPVAKRFREHVVYAMGPKRGLWKPRGLTAAVILFESPEWVSQKFETKKIDVDNRVKPVFDAIEEATGAPDELHWQFHVFKVLSKRKRTIVYLFDLGDIAESYG